MREKKPTAQDVVEAVNSMTKKSEFIEKLPIPTELKTWAKNRLLERFMEVMNKFIEL